MSKICSAISGMPFEDAAPAGEHDPLLRLRSKPARRISVSTSWQISSARACTTSPSTWRAMIRGLRSAHARDFDRVLLGHHGRQRASVLLLDLLGLVDRRAQRHRHVVREVLAADL
jgi:hypothetical protein